jgi:hypothetical protein
MLPCFTTKTHINNPNGKSLKMIFIIRPMFVLISSAIAIPRPVMGLGTQMTNPILGNGVFNQMGQYNGLPVWNQTPWQ